MRSGYWAESRRCATGARSVVGASAAGATGGAGRVRTADRPGRLSSDGKRSRSGRRPWACAASPGRPEFVRDSKGAVIDGGSGRADDAVGSARPSGTTRAGAGAGRRTGRPGPPAPDATTGPTSNRDPVPPGCRGIRGRRPAESADASHHDRRPPHSYTRSGGAPKQHSCLGLIQLTCNPFAPNKLVSQQADTKDSFVI